MRFWAVLVQISILWRSIGTKTGSSVRQNLRIYKSGAFVKILGLEAFSVRQNFGNTKEIRFVKEILELKV